MEYLFLFFGNNANLRLIPIIQRKLRNTLKALVFFFDNQSCLCCQKHFREIFQLLQTSNKDLNGDSNKSPDEFEE